ncbi:8508_t:CDS:2 [Ambispora gerdemannii]|uniref:Calcium-transporting ATPase n=1 Tax=Ambispora gerdemannii TaxID=144530 RepID=A0A9N8Z3Z7_9GLOM|nr:8508_t:CDS:2 [Ambispora gerdemannii]
MASENSENKNTFTNLPTSKSTSSLTQDLATVTTTNTSSSTRDSTTSNYSSLENTPLSKKQPPRPVPNIKVDTSESIIDQEINSGTSPTLLSVKLANSSQPSPSSTTSTKQGEELEDTKKTNMQRQLAEKPDHNDTIIREEREEKTEVYVENPFSFNPKILSRLIDPKNIILLKKLGGIKGLLKGLHTDPDFGLSNDEKAPLPPRKIDNISSRDDVGDDDLLNFENKPKDDIEDAAKKPKKKRQSKKAKKAALANAELTKDGAPFSQRKRVFGVNVLPTKKTKNIFELMWIAMQDKILIILTFAAFLSLGLGLYEDFGPNSNKKADEPKIKWVEGVAIIIAILIVVMVGSINDWQKEKQFQRLNAKKEDRNLKVTRDGKEALISVHDVLVGDILHIEPGDIIAVDGVLISGHNLRCDESAATGESDAVRKSRYEECLNLSDQESTSDAAHHSKADPFLISGSKVLEGVGTYVVTAVGENSFYGRILMALRTDAGDTPLQEKLNGLAERIAKLGGAAALLMLIVLLIKYFVNFRNGVPPATKAVEDLVRIIISTVTVVVVAVPEGLPLAVTLALAYATTRMLKDNNLVRVLSACETMGNANTICSDKTGTLTQNKMSVVAGTIGISTAFVRDYEAYQENSKRFSQKSVTENINNPIPMTDLIGTLSPGLINILKQSIAINSTAFESMGDDGKLTFIGSKTETALLSFLIDLGLNDYKELRSDATIMQVFPFSSDRKSMGVVVKISDSKYRFYVKGASEVLVRKAESIIVADPTNNTELSTMKLLPEHLNIIQRVIVKYASQTLRTIALGYQEFEEWPPRGMKANEEGVSFEELVDKIILLAIVGIEDPLRDGVRESVQKCQKAGVSIVMVTGDNVLTAKSIATQCGIYNPGDTVMEGPQFRNLPPQEMDKRIPRLTVLARSSPEDKRILVAKLKELGRIVAVTGDGTNDGPALKTADVGFSMGIAGTEVAKEASSIILMDDNFSSIVKAIMWGRSVNDSVKKFLQFQLTVNVTAVLLTFISAVSSGEESSVLSAVQLLWVNLIMDTLAALALATDPPTEELLNRDPEPRNAPLISHDMWKMIIGQSVFQLVITLILLYAGNDILNYDTDEEQEGMKTLIFNTFVYLQIFNEINCRRLDNKLNIFKNIFANRFFMVIFVIICVGQILIVQLGGAAFQVNPLDGIQWAISIGLGFLSIPVGIIIRLIPVPSFSSKQQQQLQASNSTYASSVGRTTQTGEPSWNKAITDVQNELMFFKSLRGGRLRASLHFDKRDKNESHSVFAAATIVPSIIAGSVGGRWTTANRISRPASNNPSASQLDLSSTWFPSTSTEGAGIQNGMNESTQLPINSEPRRIEG